MDPPVYTMRMHILPVLSLNAINLIKLYTLQGVTIY